MDRKAIKAMLITPVLILALMLTGKALRVVAQTFSPFAKKPQPEIFGGAVPQAGFSGSVVPKGVDVYLLSADGTIWPYRTCDDDAIRVKLFQRGEKLIGIDFRAADGLLYGVSNLGRIYTIDVTPSGRGNVTMIGTLSPRFGGGFQSLMDFNPVVNAIRLIGSSDENFAVVNSGGNLNVTVVQTKITYAQGDISASFDPNISGGAYNNNLNGATVTLFYAIDNNLHTLVMPPLAANGSSATGAGVFKTIGYLKTRNGAPFILSPIADLDIYTDANGVNYLVGISGSTLFSIDLNQIDSAQAIGVTQDVFVDTNGIRDGGFIDIALRARGDCDQ